MKNKFLAWVSALSAVALVSGVLIVSANAHIGASHSPFDSDGPDLLSATVTGDDSVKFCFDEEVADEDANGDTTDYELGGFDDEQFLGADDLDLASEDECVDATFDPPSEKVVDEYTIARIQAGEVEDRGGDAAPLGAVELDGSTAPGDTGPTGTISADPNLESYTTHAGANTISYFFDESVDCTELTDGAGGAPDDPDAENFGFYMEDEADNGTAEEVNGDEQPEIAIGDEVVDCGDNEVEVEFLPTPSTGADDDSANYAGGDSQTPDEESLSPIGGAEDVEDAERVFATGETGEEFGFNPSNDVCDPDQTTGNGMDDGCLFSDVEASDEDLDDAPDLTDVERTDDTELTYTFDENLEDAAADIIDDNFFLILEDGYEIEAVADDCDVDNSNEVACDFDNGTVTNLDEMEDDEFAIGAVHDCAVVSENDEICSTEGSFSATSGEGPGMTDAPDLEDCDIDDASDVVSYIFDEDVDEDTIQPQGDDFYTFDAESDETNGDAGDADVEGNVVDVEYEDEDLSDQIGCGVVDDAVADENDDDFNENVEATVGTEAASSPGGTGSTVTTTSTSVVTTTTGGGGQGDQKAASTITIRYDRKPKSKAAFKGSVSNKFKKCTTGRQVELRRKGKGLKGRDKTNDKGNYSIRKDAKKGKWFTKVLKKVFTQSDGDVITCKSDESVRINV